MQKLNTVWVESDLTKFKTIVGNRSVDEVRVRKIMKSIREVGMIPAPIIVNDLMEVIDGQGRMEACKRLGLPVPFVIIKGLGIKECRAMNIYGEKWNVLDYLESYANAGNQNYVRFLDFFRSCGFSLSIAAYFAMRSHLSNKTDAIKSGRLIFSEEDAARSRKLSDFAHLFDDIETNRRGSFIQAIVFCFCDPEVDNELLVKKIHQSPRDFRAISSMEDCIQVIEEVYNRRCRNRVYIHTNFRKHMQSKLSFYGKEDGDSLFSE